MNVYFFDKNVLGQFKICKFNWLCSAVTHFKDTYQVTSSGRFSVKLPKFQTLPNSVLLVPQLCIGICRMSVLYDAREAFHNLRSC